jgi:hypothetical protein
LRRPRRWREAKSGVSIGLESYAFKMIGAAESERPIHVKT